MAVVEGVAFLVADSFEELVDPDRGVDGETFVGEGIELDGAGTGRENGPEALNTHLRMGGDFEELEKV